MLKQIKENKLYKFKYEIGDLVYSVDENKNIIYEHRIFKRESIKTEEILDNSILSGIVHIYNDEFHHVLPKTMIDLFDTREEAEIHLRNLVEIEFVPTEMPEWAIKLKKV
jgi:hypothetical protein